MVEGSRGSSIAAPHDHTPKPSEAHERPKTESTLARELAPVRSALEHNMRKLSVLISDRNNRRMTRAAGELGPQSGHGNGHPEDSWTAEVIDDCARLSRPP